MSKEANLKTRNPLCKAKRTCSAEWRHAHCKECDEPCAVNRAQCSECDWELREPD